MHFFFSNRELFYISDLWSQISLNVTYYAEGFTIVFLNFYIIIRIRRLGEVPPPLTLLPSEHETDAAGVPNSQMSANIFSQVLCLKG